MMARKVEQVHRDHGDCPHGLAAHLEFMIVGGLIVTFLILEPHGLAQLWRVIKEKLRLWPFPH